MAFLLTSVFFQISHILYHLLSSLISHLHLIGFPSLSSGADFTNSFRCLSQVRWPSEGEEEAEALKQAVHLLMEQCASLPELKDGSRPTMDPRYATYTHTHTHTHVLMALAGTHTHMPHKG